MQRARDVFFPISDWLPAYLLTVAIEAPIIWLGFKSAEPSAWRLAVLFLFANLATHLVVWYVMTQLFDATTSEYVVASEGWAIGAEAIFFAAAIRGISAARAFGVAVTANVASAAVGVLVMTPWPDLRS